MSERDQRCSRRMLLAAALLRRGVDPEQVAATTGVPLALLELIRDEQSSGSGAASGRPAPEPPR